MLSIDDLNDKICCDIVFDYGARILANLKIENLSENEIILKCKKTKIKIIGSDLKILSFSKGEIEISGKVDGVVKV